MSDYPWDPSYTPPPRPPRREPRPPRRVEPDAPRITSPVPTTVEDAYGSDPLTLSAPRIVAGEILQNPDVTDRDRFLLSDVWDPMSDRYAMFLSDADTYGWDQETFAAEGERRGIWQWISQKLADYQRPSGGGRRGFGRGGGGGGGAGRAQAIESAKAAIRNQAGLFGIPMTDEQISDLANKAVENNYSLDQIVDTMLEAVDWAQLQPGQLNAAVNDIRALGTQYLLPVSDETARDYSQRLASGEIDQAGIRSLFTEQARNEYGFLAEQLDAGITPADFFAPMRDVMARTLEINPADIDLMDSDVRDALTVRNEDGTTRAASLTEVEFQARQDPRWQWTTQAQNRVAAAGVALAQAFGSR